MTTDHEERRRRIAEITIDVIAREGVGAATIRRIAAEAAFSTTAITHYFIDKQALMIFAFQSLSAEGERRFQEELAREPPDTIGALLTMVPWNAANLRRWKAYLAFWDEAARNPELAVALARSTRTGMIFLQQLLRPLAPPEADLEKAGRLLNAFIQGSALQILVDPGDWNAQTARAALTEAVELALGAPRLLQSSARPGAS